MDPHGLLTDWLRTTFPVGPPLPANRSVPPFLLPDHEGWLVSSEEMRARGPYVLTFFHGSWCAACVTKLRDLEAALDRIYELGADVVACSPETLEHPRRLKTENELRFHVVADVDCALSIDLGVAFPVPTDTRRLLQDAGVDLQARQGDGRWMLPVSMTLIVDRRGRVVAAFDDTDRAVDVAGILAALIDCGSTS